MRLNRQSEIAIGVLVACARSQMRKITTLQAAEASATERTIFPDITPPFRPLLSSWARPKPPSSPSWADTASPISYPAR